MILRSHERMIHIHRIVLRITIILTSETSSVAKHARYQILTSLVVGFNTHLTPKRIYSWPILRRPRAIHGLDVFTEDSVSP